VAYAITQHPADMVNLEGMNVTDLSQYELIEQCSVFVSRFATGIIEALAAGKPAIYFNPHGEKVRKFAEPLGAFRIAHNANELGEAIQTTLDDIESGTDFRQQAAAFLKYHADFDGESSAVIKTSQAIQDIAECHLVPDGSIIDMYLNAFHQDYSPTAGTGLIGDFTRDQHAIFEEEEFIALLFGGSSSSESAGTHRTGQADKIAD
jgi:hypothetical protein